MYNKQNDKFMLMKSIIKQFVILIFLVVVTVSFSGCNKSEVNEKEMQDVQIRFEQFIRDNGKEITLNNVDTTNWQDYIDEERGFSFKYPNDWTLKEMPYKKHRMYKDCYKMSGTEHGGCGDEFAHYDIKTTLHPTAFLCLIPNNENFDGNCFITFSQIDPILKNVGTAVDVYDRNYREKFDKPYEYLVTNNETFMFDYLKFSILKNTVVSVEGYNWTKLKMILLNDKYVTEENKNHFDVEYRDDFLGIIQSVNIIEK
jgi:hypothetical protein